MNETQRWWQEFLREKKRMIKFQLKLIIIESKSQPCDLNWHTEIDMCFLYVQIGYVYELCSHSLSHSPCAYFFMISWYWIPLLFGCFGIRKIQIKYGQYKAHIHKR